MPTAAEPPQLLVDTSVAVALAVADHEHHGSVRDALRGMTLGLAGHAAFETFSVLTRLPPPHRRTPASVHRLLARNFPASRFLDPDDAAGLLERLAQLGLSGGAVYDALVGAVAVRAGVPLATRDRRALSTYRALEAPLQLLE